jgi:hypothetical protein
VHTGTHLEAIPRKRRISEHGQPFSATVAPDRHGPRSNHNASAKPVPNLTIQCPKGCVGPAFGTPFLVKALQPFVASILLVPNVADIQSTLSRGFVAFAPESHCDDSR